MADFASVTDIQNLKRALTSAEQTRAGYLLSVVSDIIRYEATKVGKDADALVAADPAFANVVKAVTVDVVMRELNTPGTQLPATQYAEAAGSVSMSYSMPNGSGRIALWPSDLKSLGFRRQLIGSLPLWSAPVNGGGQ
jgi:hypothetical protein